MFVSFLCLYLLTIGFTPPRGDAIPMWDAANNLVRHGTLAIDLRWPINVPLGRGGHPYPVAALLAVLAHVPGAIVESALAALVPGRAHQLVFVTSELGPVVLGAFALALFYRLLLELGYGRRAAAWTTLLLGAGTSVAVYAHRPYSEIVQAVCFVMFLRELLAAGETPSPRAFVRWGLTAALLVNSKNIYFVCLPGALVYLAWRLGARRRELVTGLGWAALGLAPGLVALAVYNEVRWGSVLASGYGAVTVGFWRENIFLGLWGQLLSPGKSLFLFSPPLVLALCGVRRLVARRRHVGVAIALVVGPILLVYARYLFWAGDWGWGPRYLVFALPAFVLPAAELFEGAPRWSWLGRAAIGGLCLLGVAVQVLGSAFYWDDFIAVARAAQYSWLGHPNSRGSALAPYDCYSCMDELYSVQWLPSMQPIEGHWWLLRHKLAHDDWQAAAGDAPWARYTSLALNVEAPYDRAEIDWWPLLAPPGRRLPLALLTSICLALLLPWRRWIAALRSDDAPAPGGS